MVYQDVVHPLFQYGEGGLRLFKALNLGDDIYSLGDEVFQGDDRPVTALQNYNLILAESGDLIFVLSTGDGKKHHILSRLEITVFGYDLYFSKGLCLFRIPRWEHDAIRPAFQSSCNHILVPWIRFYPNLSHNISLEMC